MSTRSQLQVVQDGMRWEEKVTLYHHSDGYPTNIAAIVRDTFNKLKADGVSYEIGRAGKVASYLCAADPGQFEPEEGHQRHGDIEWYYVLHAVNTAAGSMAENVQWLLDIENVRSGQEWKGLEMKQLTASKLEEIEHADDEED
jgi:hypothetical protein